MLITEILARNARLYGDDTALVERDPAAATRREIGWRAFDREANRFAACLLLPDYRLIRYIDDNPDLGQVLGAARDLHCSRESVARRYSELLELPNAMLFSKDGKLRYFVRSGGIGSLDIGVGDPLRDLPPANGDTGLSDIEDMSSVGWLRYGQERDLTIQTLHQQN